MLSFAPRISQTLLEALVRLDDRSVPIAVTYRRLGEEAARRNLPRPSYERIRELVHQARRLNRGPSTLRVLADISMRARAPEELLDHVSGIGVRPLD